MNFDQPIASVIVLAFNHEKFVIQCLNSIQDQTYSNIDLVIIDDCSRDSTVNKINSWLENTSLKNVKFVQNLKNLGLTKSLNKALRLTQGAFIQFVAADDYIVPQKTKTQIEYFHKNDPKIKFTYSDCFVVDENGKTIIESYLDFMFTDINQKLIETGDIRSELLKKNFIPAPTIMYKKDLIDEFGYYDEKLNFEDWDFLLRVSKKYKIIRLAENLAFYRKHDTAMSVRKDYDFFLSIVKLMLKNCNYKETTPLKTIYYAIKNMYHLNRLTTIYFILIKSLKFSNFILLFKSIFLRKYHSA